MSKKASKHALQKKRKTSQLWVWLVAGAAVIAVLFLVLTPATPRGNISPEVTVETAAQMRDEGAFILDVREQSEWDQFHIPSSTLIPLEYLSQKLDSLPKDQIIVVVCRTGNRSAEGRDILLRAGYLDVTSMDGGVTDWKMKGFPIETGR